MDRRARIRADRGSDPAGALELCNGDLLEGLDDDWAVAARDGHRARVIELLEELAESAEERGALREATELTRRQVECDRFDEEAHRRLIERLDRAGDRASAIRSYRALAERLRRELGVAPSARTRQLVERLRSTTPAHPVSTLGPAVGDPNPPPPRVRPAGGRKAAGSRPRPASACACQPRSDLLSAPRPRQCSHRARADRADPSAGERGAQRSAGRMRMV